ncbi:MAG: T9SS type A sorting domain-containing protein, partial [Bacteroidota bacterium]|nr:T9SS type A sorting domain-containing protein [Bacteroidota bacterium]
ETITHVLCNGDATGGVDIVIAGGVTPYSIVWSNGYAGTTISGVPAGTYNATVTDSNGCTVSGSYIITEPTLIVITETVTDVLCNGELTGVIALSVTGGVTPYSYLWSNNETTAIISNLAAGFYTYTFADANGCETINTLEVTHPDTIIIVVDVSNYNGNNISCQGLTDGWIDVSVTGGLTPYSYNWGAAGTDEDLTNIGAGTYSLTFTDANGCSFVITETLTEPAELSLTVTVSNYNGFGVSCFGETDGSITITPTGGTTPYTYLWSIPFETGSSVSSLGAGFYSVTVTDDNGCFGTQFITITEPALITYALEDTGLVSNNGYSVSCNGFTDGGIIVNNLTGGLPPYIFEWTDTTGAVVGTTQDLSSIGAGWYFLLVTDVNQCVMIDSILLIEPSELLTSALITNDYNGYAISCNGETDGAIDVTVSGGVAPYTYNWDGIVSTDEDLSNIGAGTYTVTITDDNGCFSVHTLTLTEPDQLASTLNAVDISCFGENDGAVYATITGGVTPYDYLWSNTVTIVDSIVGLYAGTYGITVTDLNGCIIIDNATVIEPDVLALSFTVDSDTCGVAPDGAIDITITGGTTPYSYSWSNGEVTEDISTLISDTYEVTVTDAHGCIIEESIFVPFSGDYPIANFDNVNAGGTVVFVNFSQNASSFTWNFGDGTTQTVTNMNNIMHQYSATGYYIVELIAENDCGSDTMFKEIYVRVTDIEEFGNSVLVNLFPNPTDGRFTISYETDHFVGDIIVRIFDAVGRIVEEDKFFIDNISMDRQYDLSNYNYGTYMVQIITKDGVLVKPIILNRR